jgi:hypothetical protein
LLKAVAPYRADLVVCVECIFTWDWLADLWARAGKQHDPHPLSRLQLVPGIGKILCLVLLDAIHTIDRLPRVHGCVSYCRLVTCAKESAGKRYGTSGTKNGNT